MNFDKKYLYYEQDKIWMCNRIFIKYRFRVYHQKISKSYILKCVKCERMRELFLTSDQNTESIQ